jgi:hypothetical protein
MLPRAVASRGFVIKMVPPKTDEKLTDSAANYDEEEFQIIRRKLLRWSMDNADAIAAIAPSYPEGLTKQTRPKANWKLPLQIARHAGDKWLEAAHAAILFLSQRGYAPSKGIEALAALKRLLRVRAYILSHDAVMVMTADPHSPWRAFVSPGRTHPHPISVNEFAALLAKYDTAGGAPIQPHPIKREGNRRGYTREQIADACERFADRIARVDVSWADYVEPPLPEPEPEPPPSAPEPTTARVH